jgi:hypothetical protein
MSNIHNPRIQLEGKIRGLTRLVEKLKTGECLGRPEGHDMDCGEGPDWYKKYCSEACRLRAEIKELKGE